MIRFSDSSPIGRVKETSEGYVTAYARAVRAGVQKYLASEIGMVGDYVVNVYRPESEVRSVDSLISFSHATVTNDHPAEMVTKDNWKELSVGEVSTEAHWDGEFIALPLVLKDAKAISDVKSGKVELSAGYTADIDFEDGVAPDGVPYQAVQRNIRINHLAIVDRARAGSRARIGDAKSWGASPVTVEDKVMTVELKTVILGDKSVQVEAKDADTVAAILKDHKTAIDAKDAEIVVLTKRAADAEAKVLSDAQIKELVDAKIKSDADRAKVLAVVKDEDKVAAMSDEAIAGALAVLGDAAVDDSAREAIKNKQPILDAEAKIKASIEARFNKGNK